MTFYLFDIPHLPVVHFVATEEPLSLEYAVLGLHFDMKTVATKH